MSTTLPGKPLELTVVSSYGSRTIRVSSVADVDRHLTEQTVARNIARHPAHRKTRELRLDILMVGCDLLLDARLELAERELVAVVDAWTPMPDFGRLVRQGTEVTA